jgi:hypothetical protein
MSTHTHTDIGEDLKKTGGFNTKYCKEVNSLQTDLHMQYNSNENLNRVFFPEIDKLVLKSVWKCKEPIKAKIILRKSKVSGLTVHEAKYLMTKLQ